LHSFLYPKLYWFLYLTLIEGRASTSVTRTQ